MQCWPILLLAITGFTQGQRIVTGPSSVTQKAGREADFECVVDFEQGVPSIQWHFKMEIIYSFERGKEDFPYGRIKYDVTQDGKVYKLTVKDLDFENGGKYTCEVIAGSATALLIVLDTPQLITATPNPAEGTRAEYICTAQFAGPKEGDVRPDHYPQLRMFFDGKQIQATVQQQEFPKNCYKVSQSYDVILQASMYGKNLTCDIGTFVPEMNITIVIELIMQYRVRNIRFFPNNKQYEVGSVINCTAEGNPEPHFVWDDINNPENFMDGPLLQITENMLKENKNFWRCVASNTINGLQHKTSDVAVFEAVVPAVTMVASASEGVCWKIVASVTTICMLLLALNLGIACRWYLNRKKKNKEVTSPVTEAERLNGSEQAAEEDATN